ncbi:FMN-binding glutamate synthase family protein [Bauldia sp.]|uniref:FMN-binding glutamate synthase family protein n=1 Tax=Bauldia sp. TaxID=2575872 RepID=UPI003BADA4D1
MARRAFFLIAGAGLLAIVIIAFFWPPVLWFLIFFIPYTAIGLYDLYLSGQNVLRNYPVIGHLRYGLEFISPEIRQYFIETNESGRPYDRLQRDLVSRRSENKPGFQPFGTQYDITDTGYNSANHSLAPKKVSETSSRVTFGGSECKQPYDASRLNISAMSFGALSPNAIRALNAGAKIGSFAHNTGEGGLSPYHLQEGGDIIWQIGTGYFGCRTKDGHFDPAQFKDKAANDAVKMIEIKLSQGAKPSHGGVLPAAKVDEEIARIRGVEPHRDVISPPAHSTFSTPEGLLEYVAQLRDLTGGKPIGFKLCIGKRSEFMGICKAMLKTNILPDFITIDGAEGGTGAAPVEFSDRLGEEINEALVFVHNCLVGTNVRDKLKVIASGKVITGFHIVEKIALGADTCNAARTMLFAIGCIQAIRCNTNTCPSGVATQDPKRWRAVDVEVRKYNVANYHNQTVDSFLDLVGAMGYDSPDKLGPNDILRRVANHLNRSYAFIYDQLEPGHFLKDEATIHPDYRDHWMRARAEAF